jgi:hypothetical protein
MTQVAQEGSCSSRTVHGLGQTPDRDYANSLSSCPIMLMCFFVSTRRFAGYIDREYTSINTQVKEEACMYMRVRYTWITHIVYATQIIQITQITQITQILQVKKKFAYKREYIDRTFSSIQDITHMRVHEHTSTRATPRTPAPQALTHTYIHHTSHINTPRATRTPHKHAYTHTHVHVPTHKGH